MSLQKVVTGAGASDRAVEAALDAFMAAIVLFVVTTLTSWFLALLPNVDDGPGFGAGLCSGQSTCNYDWTGEIEGSTGASFWLSLGFASVLFLLVSGAFSRTRRSPGMLAAGTIPVMAHSIGGPDVTPPSRTRILLRWLIVLVLFILGTFIGGNGFWGIGLVTLAWLPSLLGPRRALYDLATGTAVAHAAFQDSAFQDSHQP
ncbi:MAG TPA: hypothetical protein VMT88_02510 [Actinomycetes bacterium]|nr:hypothetical protein [Actinomycetes bacterium]